MDCVIASFDDKTVPHHTFSVSILCCIRSHLKPSDFSVSLIPQAVGRFRITSRHKKKSRTTKFLNEFGLCSPISYHIDPSGGNFVRTTALPHCTSICCKLCATAFLRVSTNQESNNGVHHSHSHDAREKQKLIHSYDIGYPMS